MTSIFKEAYPDLNDETDKALVQLMAIRDGDDVTKIHVEEARKLYDSIAAGDPGKGEAEALFRVICKRWGYKGPAGTSGWSE